jgi:hypothetical protein
MEKIDYASFCCRDRYGFSADQIGTMMEQNQHEAIIMTRDEFVCFVQDKAGNDRNRLDALQETFAQTSFKEYLKGYWNTTLAPNIGNAGVVPASQFTSDAFVIGKTLSQVGISASYYLKDKYIILKGYSGLRKILTGTRYLATNPAIVQVGFGLKGIQGMAKGAFVLGLVVSSGIETLDWLAKDEKTMVDLVGGIGVEAVKVGIASVVGYAFAAALTVTGVAALPLIGLAGMSCYVAWKLNELDNTYNIKQTVIRTLKSLPDNLEHGFYILRDAMETDWKREVEKKIEEFEDWIIRAAEHQVEAFLRKTVMHFFRYSLQRIR